VAAGDTHPSVGAIAVVRDDLGRVLLVWQTGGPFAGSWLLPGGGVERDEGVSHAAARELREETGLEATDGKVVAVYQTRSDPSGAFDMTVFMYDMKAEGELKAERGSDVRWFDAASIPNPHPALRRQLFDAGIGRDSEAEIVDALATAGIAMERLA
jgi:8-oxo-dGTP diphosphatase